jgi:VanZ family protein
MNRYFWITAPLCWAVFLCWLHLIKVSVTLDSSFRFPHADKLVHACMFLGQAALITRYFQVRYALFILPKKRQFFIWLITISFGAVLEWSQQYAPSQRSTDWYDWMADCFGAALGIWLALRIKGTWISASLQHQSR